MRYMMFIKHRDDYDISKVPQSLFGAMDEFIGKCIKDGSFIDGGGLQPTKAASRVRLAKGKITSTDGPFTEAKEVVGGYAIFDVDTKEEVLEWTRRFMDLHKKHWPDWEGETEVRQMSVMGPPPHR